MIDEINKNRQLWDQWSSIHIDSEFYNLPSFLQGASTLNELEMDELGKVDGLSVLHLQCHLGMDSISLARMGAEVTGVDFSEVAIKKARELAKQMEISVNFILSDIYNLKEWINKKFDMVFTSYGVIPWLPDLNEWAALISWCLKPGGTFYMAEFHPVFWMFDDQFKQIRYPYDSSGSPLQFSNVSSYAAPEIPLMNQEFNWQHGVGSVINSLIKSGLRIEFLNEHYYSPYPVFPDAVVLERSKWVHKKFQQDIPYIFSIRANKY
jgi:SAM-dependent methyltransferase